MSVPTLEGSIRISPEDRFGIAVSRFNEPVTDRLLTGALEEMRRHGVANDQLTVVRVPGAFELPLVARRLIAGGMDAVLALGAVIRGETSHFDFVAAEVARGCSDVALALDVPVVFGVLTTESAEQAYARAGGAKGNKGAEAAETALRLVDLRRQLDAVLPVQSPRTVG